MNHLCKTNTFRKFSQIMTLLYFKNILQIASPFLKTQRYALLHILMLQSLRKSFPPPNFLTRCIPIPYFHVHPFHTLVGIQKLLNYFSKYFGDKTRSTNKHIKHISEIMLFVTIFICSTILLFTRSLSLYLLAAVQKYFEYIAKRFGSTTSLPISDTIQNHSYQI